MCDKVIQERCPSRVVLGAARLENYRLGFRRKLNRTGTGAADVLPSLGMVVWGVLYEINQSELSELDRREGYKADDSSSSVYKRIKVNVYLIVNEEQSIYKNVETYTVSNHNKQPKDIPPSLDYVENMIKGAVNNGLPDNYIYFLRWLNHEMRELDFPNRFLVFCTSSREGSRGLGLLKISSSATRSLQLASLAVVLYEQKVCLVQVLSIKSLDKDSCEIDQSVREILGIRGRETYGTRVDIFPVRGNRLGFPFVNPRTLVLNVSPPAWLDSEKSICILHENNIRLLGLTEGEYVRISTVKLSKKSNQYQIREITLRVFSGISSFIGNNEEYPDVRKIYLDKDSRRKLDIEADRSIVVSADPWKMFTSRLLYYGVTLFLGVNALAPVIQAAFNLSGALSFGLTLFLSAMITLVLSVFDIRGKIQY